MRTTRHSCPDCEGPSITRRDFVKIAGAGTAALVVAPALANAVATENSPETAVKRLHSSLSDEQKKKICFGWDHKDERRGLLRTRVGATGTSPNRRSTVTSSPATSGGSFGKCLRELFSPNGIPDLINS